MKPLVSALAALALLFHPALAMAGPLPADQLERIDAAARKALKDSGVPSVQVAVVKDSEIVLTRAWGKASETIPEAGPDLQYQIASNSKQFLAALFLILENDGKLDLDDPVSKWLPELPSGGEDHDPPVAQPYRRPAGLLAAGLFLCGNGNTGGADRYRAALGLQGARL